MIYSGLFICEDSAQLLCLDLRTHVFGACGRRQRLQQERALRSIYRHPSPPLASEEDEETGRALRTK